MVETESKEKKRKERETEGQKRDKLNRNDGKERRKLRAGRACFLFLRLLFCAVLFFTACQPFPLTEADQYLEVSRDARSHPDYRIRRLGGVKGVGRSFSRSPPLLFWQNYEFP